MVQVCDIWSLVRTNIPLGVGLVGLEPDSAISRLFLTRLYQCISPRTSLCVGSAMVSSAFSDCNLVYAETRMSADTDKDVGGLP